MDSAVNLDSNLVLKLVVAELLVDQDLRGVCNLMLVEETVLTRSDLTTGGL